MNRSRSGQDPTARRDFGRPDQDGAFSHLRSVSPEVVVGPEWRLRRTSSVSGALILRRRLWDAMGRGVGHSDHAPQVGRAQPALLVVVRAVQLPALLLKEGRYDILYVLRI